MQVDSNVPFLSRFTTIENQAEEMVKLQEVVWPSSLIRSEIVMKPGQSIKLKATRFCYYNSNPDRNAVVWVRADAYSSDYKLLMPSDFVNYSKIIILTDANSKLKLKGFESSWTNLPPLKGFGWLAALCFRSFTGPEKDIV